MAFYTLLSGGWELLEGKTVWNNYKTTVENVFNCWNISTAEDVQFHENMTVVPTVTELILTKWRVVLMVSTEASWWNNLKLEIHTTLDCIVSLILLNLGHVFRFRIVSDAVMMILTKRKWNTCPKFKRNKWNNITKSCVYLQFRNEELFHFDYHGDVKCF